MTDKTLQYVKKWENEGITAHFFIDDQDEIYTKFLDFDFEPVLGYQYLFKNIHVGRIKPNPWGITGFDSVEEIGPGPEWSDNIKKFFDL